MSRQRFWPFEEAWRRIMWDDELGPAPWWARQVVRFDGWRIKVWMKFLFRVCKRQDCGCLVFLGRRQTFCTIHLRTALKLPADKGGPTT